MVLKVKDFLSSTVYSVSSYCFTSWGFSQSNGGGGGTGKEKESKKKKERNGGSFVHITFTVRLIFKLIVSKENQKLKVYYLKFYLGLQIFASLYA